jgi:outer membrane beta-barrel protein
MHFLWRLLLFLSVLLIFPDTSQAELNEGGKIVAVQGRRYKLKHEFHGSGGILPLDAFAKGLVGGGSYTYHFNDFFGLELINFQYSRNLNTGLRDDLEQNFGVTTTQFDLVNYYLTSGVVVKPAYGKMILFNRTLLHGEVSIAGVGGVIKYDSGFRPTGGVGLIFRVWFTPMWSIRADARDYVAITAGDIENILQISLGFSFSFSLE